MFRVTDTRTESEDMRALRDYIGALHAEGGTAIYDALSEAYRLTKAQSQQDPERSFSIVLLTDGANTNGSDLAHFESEFQRQKDTVAGVKTFPILFGSSNGEEMMTLGELTGGRTFDAHKLSLARVFKEIRGYQ